MTMGELLEVMTVSEAIAVALIAFLGVLVTLAVNRSTSSRDWLREKRLIAHRAYSRALDELSDDYSAHAAYRPYDDARTEMLFLATAAQKREMEKVHDLLWQVKSLSTRPSVERKRGEDSLAEKVKELHAAQDGVELATRDAISESSWIVRIPLRWGRQAAKNLRSKAGLSMTNKAPVYLSQRGKSSGKPTKANLDG